MADAAGRLTADVAVALEGAYARALAGSATTLRFTALANGDVLVKMVGDGGAFAHARVAPKAARQWASALLEAASEAERIAGELRGERLWICWPDSEHDDWYLVRHAGVTRSFRPTRVRRPRRCNACREIVDANAVMWREAEPHPYARVNLREARLCRGCITAPLPGEGSVGGVIAQPAR